MSAPYYRRDESNSQNYIPCSDCNHTNAGKEIVRSCQSPTSGTKQDDTPAQTSDSTAPNLSIAATQSKKRSHDGIIKPQHQQNTGLTIRELHRDFFKLNLLVTREKRERGDLQRLRSALEDLREHVTAKRDGRPLAIRSRKKSFLEWKEDVVR